MVINMCGGKCVCGNKAVWDTEFDFVSEDKDTVEK